jgi:hypothetical protein
MKGSKQTGDESHEIEYNFMRYAARVIVIMVLLFAAVYLGFQIYLWKSIRASDRDAQASVVKDIYESPINGTVYLQNFQNLHCTLFLAIISKNGKVKSDNSIRLCPCQNGELESFVSDGDSISKGANSFEAKFFKKNGVSKKIELPLCK